MRRRDGNPKGNCRSETDRYLRWQRECCDARIEQQGFEWMRVSGRGRGAERRVEGRKRSEDREILLDIVVGMLLSLLSSLISTF